MKKYTFILIICFNLQIIIINAQPEQKIHPVDTILYPYLFKQGSYWIYQNDSTKDKDTIVFKKSNHYYLTLHSGDLEERYWTSFYPKRKVTDTFFYQYSASLIGLNYPRTIIFAPTAQIGEDVNGSKNIAFFDTFTVKQKEFYGVWEINFGNNVYYYWAKHAGVIRKDTVYTDHIATWNLIDWETNTLSVKKEAPINKSLITLYPNPCNDRITFDLSKSSGISEITIYNMNGELVCSLKNVNSKTIVYNTTELLNGLYLIKFNFQNKVIIQKFIKI
jgi:hypothetical protein